jgi:hypothetical protein
LFIKTKEVEVNKAIKEREADISQINDAFNLIQKYQGINPSDKSEVGNQSTRRGDGPKRLETPVPLIRKEKARSVEYSSESSSQEKRHKRRKKEKKISKNKKRSKKETKKRKISFSDSSPSETSSLSN